jgi:hypothetical protein
MPFQSGIGDQMKFGECFSSELMMTLDDVLNQGGERLVFPIFL